MKLNEYSLRQLIVIENKSFSEVSRLFGKSIKWISLLAKKYNIHKDHKNTPKIGKLPIPEIYEKYMNGISLNCLHKQYNCPIARLKRNLIKNYPNLQIRYNKEKLNPYYCDWKATFKTHGECSDWLIQHGFQGVKYPESILKLGIERLNHITGENRLNANIVNIPVSSLIRHFSQHYYRSYHNGYIPISKAWEVGNRVVLKQAVEMLWNIDRKCNIYNLVLYIGRYFKDFAPISIFKPWVASYIYDKFLPNGGKVMDPCMGWGGRLLGCFGRNIKYVGYDLNPNSVNSVRDLYNFVGMKDCCFYEADSRKVDFEDADLLFTSPPYDSTEYYYGIDSSKTKTEPILENVFKKFKGIVVLNIPLRQRDLCLSSGSNFGWKLVEELQMKTTSFMGRTKTYEPILIFNK